jgi:hypothetical protein
VAIKHLFVFDIRNGLKEGDALLLLLFIFALEYAKNSGGTEIEWIMSASGWC